LVASPANKKPLSSIPAGAVQPKGAVLRTILGLLRRKIKLDPVGRFCLDRPSSVWTARHAACMLRRQAPRQAAPCQRRGRQTASASSGRLAPWLRSSSGPSVTARAPPRRPSPRKTGPRACGSAAGCAVPESGTAGCFATGSAASAGLGSLRCRLRGGTARLGLRPHVALCINCLRWFIPPPAQRVAARGASAATRLPLPMLAPRCPSAPEGLPESGQALRFSWRGITLAPAFSLSR